MSETEKSSIMQMLQEIREKLEAPRVEKIVLDVEEIVALFGKKKGSGYRIVNAPNFPAPCHAEGYIGRCWLKSDVAKWAKSNQIRNERALA